MFLGPCRERHKGEGDIIEKRTQLKEDERDHSTSSESRSSLHLQVRM